MIEMKQKTKISKMVMIILRGIVESIYTNTSKMITSTLRSILKMMGSIRYDIREYQ